jgi:long-chain fatty acid transport protein
VGRSRGALKTLRVGVVSAGSKKATCSAECKAARIGAGWSWCAAAARWKPEPLAALVCIVSVCACGLWAAEAEASIADILGVGSRGTAMGMAYSAVAEDYSAVFYNPAGLTQTDRVEVTVQITHAKARFTVRNRDELIRFYQERFNLPADSTMVTRSLSTGDMPDARGVMLGLSGDLGYLTGAKNLYLGLALYVPFGKLVETPVVFRTDEIPYFVRYVDNLQGMDMHVGLGYRIMERVSVGAGLHVFLNLEGETFIDTVLLDLKDIQNPKSISVLPGVNRQAIMAYAPTASVLFRPLDRLRVGITYRGENKAKIEYNQYITIGLRQPAPTGTAEEKSINLLVASLPFDYVFYFTPRSVTVGLAYQLGDRMLVSGDLAWYEYSHFVDGKGNDPHPRFDDILVPRLGIDYKVSDRTHLYAGYFYEPSPVPDQRTANDYLDMDRHVLSAGAGVTFDAPFPFWRKELEVQGFFQGQIMEPRGIQKSRDGDSYGPNYSIKGYILQGGVSLVFHY